MYFAQFTQVAFILYMYITVFWGEQKPGPECVQNIELTFPFYIYNINDKMF